MIELLTIVLVVIIIDNVKWNYICFITIINNNEC